MAFTNKVPKPNASEVWTPVNLETAPSAPVAGIAEADIAIVNNSDPGAGNNPSE